MEPVTQEERKRYARMALWFAKSAARYHDVAQARTWLRMATWWTYMALDHERERKEGQNET